MGRSIAWVGIVALLIGGLGGYVAGSGTLPSLANRAAAADECATFSETGKTVCGEFLTYWRDHGGLAQQGLPISEAFDERSSVDGKTYRVQYFERAVFELHPENAPPYNVLLTLLGTEKFQAKYAGGTSGAAPTSGTAKVGERAVGNGFAVTLHAVQDNVPGSSTYFKPKAGFRWFAVDISVENTGTEPLSYNLFYGKLKTTDNREWDQTTGKEPAFKSGKQAPGETVRGWITFEIPVDARPATFIYDPTFGKSRVTFDLR